VELRGIPLFRLHDFLAWTRKILRFYFQGHKTYEIRGLKGGKHGDCGLLEYDAVMLVAAGGTTRHQVAKDAILLKTNNIFIEVTCLRNGGGYRR
jgi:hypothetical protein